MKARALGAISAAVITILASCALSVPRPGAGSTELPPDTVADVTRTYAGDFDFATVLPVALKLTVSPYTEGAQRSLKKTASEGVIVAELRDAAGHLVYAGRVGSDGALNAQLQLPTGSQDMTLTLSGAGMETRQVLLRNVVRYSEIRRTLPVLFDADASRAAELLSDRDGDLVPDIYDAFPDDPASAFQYNTPADGNLTVAWEDLFGMAQAGDADYNDFIARYRVTETADAANRIKTVSVDVTADTKLAGYDHTFGIRIDSFAGSAVLTGTYIDTAGTLRSLGPQTVTAPLNVEIFQNTRYAVGQQAGFTLEFAESQSIEPGAVETDRPPYNPYLLVRNTGKEIHLMGEQDLRGSTSESFQDAQGFPWGLLVPADWVHPDEGQRIEVHYPRFTNWRESFGMLHGNWYLYYDTPYVVEAQVDIAGYYAGESSDVATYWSINNGPGGDLSTAGDSRGLAIAVYGKDVYIAGYYANNAGFMSAGYWKNGELVPVASDETGKVLARATAIHADAGGVYVAGTTITGSARRAFVWRDGSATELMPGKTSEALGIEVSAGKVYVAGYYNNGTNDVACYWVNDAAGLVELYTDGYSRANAIVSDGTHVYAAGYYVSGGLNACTWTDGAATRTELGAGNATAITLADGVVYAAGNASNGTNNAAVTWKDGVRTELYSSTVSGETAAAASICVYLGDVYVSGYSPEAGVSAACYWKNGTRTVLYSGSSSMAMALVASDKLKVANPKK
jgi:LruC domain-containing protein